MDRTEVDYASEYRKYKYKSINLKLLKDCNNQNWLVSQKSGKNTFTTVPKRAPKPKPSLKVSLPIIHYLKAIKKYNNSNARMKPLSPNQTETRRLPQQFSLPPTNPLLLSPSSLRKFRHPVPTSKGRTTLADKLDQIITTPEPISNKTNLKCNPTMTQSNINTPPIEELVKQKAETINTSESKSNATMLYKSNNEVPISIKHKLPLTLVAPKGSYGYRSNNPVNKENRLSTSSNTQTTAVQATQTEKVFFVTEEGYQILDTIKNSGLTFQDLQNQIDNFKTQMDKNNDKNCVVIDLEGTENNSSKDILDSVMKHSINNKNVLNTAVQLSAGVIMQLLTTKNQQPSVPAVVPPSERTASPSDQQPHLAETPSLSRSPVPYADMVNSFMVLATLQKFGFRLTNNALESPQTHMLPRTDSQTTQTGTQTEDENNNSKRRKRHAQKVPVLLPEQQELPMFQPQMQSRQLPQMQIQQFVPEHLERNIFPSNLPGLIPHQRNQFTMPSNHIQYPFEHNTSSALSTPEIQVQMPSSVQLPSPAQLHHSNPRSHTMLSQLGLPRLSRVLSTQEANLHGQTVQHEDCNWSFPQYVHRHGNVLPQIHQ